MTSPRSRAHSPYMEYAKLHSAAKFNLATSGVMSYPLAELQVRLEELEINGVNPYGYAPLQERLAKLNHVSEDHVVAAAGTSMANHLAMAATFDPGDEVLIEEPTYELLLSAAEFLGANIRRFPRRVQSGFAIDPDDVRKALTPRTRLIIITNLHNPSSVPVGDDVLKAVGDAAAAVGARVLIDEVYLECLWEERPKPSIHFGEQFVVTSSLTKAYGLSGVRCGWILAEPNLARRIWRLNDLFAATPAHPAELISVVALDHLDRVARRARGILEANHRTLRDFLESRNDLEVVQPGIGTTIFPKLLHGNVDDFDRFLRERYETGVVPGKFFEMPRHFRIGLGGDPAMTRSAFERMSDALDEYGKSAG
jgi:aspartate/methionine/tyrosine aminotransferase